MLALFAAVLAATTPSSTPGPSVIEPAVAEPSDAAAAASDDTVVLDSASAWWEKITVTVDDKGKQRACLYDTSLWDKGVQTCEKKLADSVQAGIIGEAGTYSKVTFERRFSPGGRVDSGTLHPGDTLLGRQVMFLTFDDDGAITSCKVVATAGDAAPAYDCDEAKKEVFRAQASAEGSAAARQAFMTILAYGHSEQIA